MAAAKKSILKKILFVIGSLISICYLFSCLTPYINPVHFWPLTFLALGFPFLLGVMLVLLILTILLFRKYTWLVVLTIALGFQNILATIAFHPAKQFVQEKTNGSIRLLSWNVNDFLDSRAEHDSLNSPHRQMCVFIKESNADILCFQDFSDYSGKGFISAFNYVRDSLGYTYTYFPIDYTDILWGGIRHEYGVAFFSKIPIVDSGRIEFKLDDTKDGVAYAGIIINGKYVRFYNAHLSSMQLHASQKAPLQEDGFIQADTALFLHTTTFRKLKQFDKIHVSEAQIIKSVLDTTHQPFIFCADLNAVPSSYVYHHISKGLQDAFLRNGFGLGSTYDSIASSLRIDVVLTNQQIRAIQHYTPHLHLSDHYPNVADLKLK